jgi:membrane protein implicated in regulation of membrane protease activity
MSVLMENLINNYGWWLLALVLIGAEMIAPGYFMLWIGLAAGIMGAITLIAPSLPAIAQALVFAALAIATCAIYWRLIRPLAEHRDDQPLLNRRGDKLVGQRVVVVEPIVNGRGKVRVGDGAWLAEGPDAPAGSEVEVIAAEGTALKVRAVG